VTFLLCGFGAFAFSQAVKGLWLPRVFSMPVRLALVFIGAFGMSDLFFLPGHPRQLVIYGLGGIGLAMGIDGLVRVFSALGDWLIRDVVRSRGQR